MNKDKNSIKLINTISVVIPLAVALILGIRTKFDFGTWTKVIPHVNAIINSATAICLVVALIFIKRKQIAQHKFFMSVSMGLGACFLVLYVIYHISNPSTSFLETGFVKYFYYFILISHILASLIVLPFVLRSYYFGLNRMDDLHLKVTKFSFPIWLYVSITGVIAYWMISPYYS
jgi:putative membrane protein